MSRWLIPLALSAVVLSGCASRGAPLLLAHYQGQDLYTCCNIYYERDSSVDANYHVGTLIPYGSPVRVEKATANSLTVNAGGATVTLHHEYGGAQESAQQYFDKLLAREDPKPKVATYSKAVQAAIHESRVEVGMTRAEVITSIGYPPTHRTPDLAAPEWTYWHNRWLTYKVVFDQDGRVARFIGTRVPTANQTIE